MAIRKCILLAILFSSALTRPLSSLNVKISANPTTFSPKPTSPRIFHSPEFDEEEFCAFTLKSVRDALNLSNLADSEKILVNMFLDKERELMKERMRSDILWENMTHLMINNQILTSDLSLVISRSEIEDVEEKFASSGVDYSEKNTIGAHGCKWKHILTKQVQEPKVAVIISATADAGMTVDDFYKNVESVYDWLSNKIHERILARAKNVPISFVADLPEDIAKTVEIVASAYTTKKVRVL